MEDLLGLLFVIVFFLLGPLLESMRQKQQPPPSQRKPPRRVYLPEQPKPAQRPTSQSQTGARPMPRDDELAATMLPDELWEVLTGQKRPQPAPAPLPPDVEPEEVADEELYPVEVVSREEIREEAVSLEESPRRAPVEVVSLETQPHPRERHAAFHRRVDAVAAAPVAARRQWLRDPEDARRAIILQAILGRPKGLE